MNVESSRWIVLGVAFLIEFGLAAILVPDMRRRQVQWWWQGLVLLALYPSSVIWFALTERRQQNESA